MQLHKDPPVLFSLANLLRKDNGERADAGEVAFVAKDLEFIKAETYDIQYPALKAVILIPIDTSVPAGAEEYSYNAWDMVGKAKFISDYAKDFPMVDAFLKRYVFPTAGIGVGYQYTLQELRKAAMRKLSGGRTLDAARAEAARMAHEQFIDDVAAFGDTARGLKGVVNHSDIPTVTLPFGSWDTLDTSDASNTKIAADLTALSIAPELATLGLYKADTLLLPLSMKKRLKYPTSTYIKQPLIDNWFQNQDDIKEIVWWNRLDAAYTNMANGSLAYTGGEALGMAYQKNPRLLYYVVPLPFTQHAPQQVGLAFQIPCESRTGGVCIPRPLTAARANFHS